MVVISRLIVHRLNQQEFKLETPGTMGLQQQLDEFIEDNECPPDDVVLHVKVLRQAPLKRIQAINAEIKRLEEERAGLEGTMKQYDRILAPIRRIPSEILRTIFEHCLPTNRNPSMDATEAPMLLTRICSSWRSAAMTSPRLWSRLYIPFLISAEAKCLSACEPSVPLDKLIKTLELRCRAVGDWLSRSGDQALSISVCYGQNARTVKSDINQIDGPSTLLFGTLLKFSSRWKHLQLSVPEGIYHTLEVMLSGHSLPLLVDLSAVVYHCMWYTYRPSDENPPTVLLRAPNLKRIFMDGITYTDWIHPTTNMTFHSPGITHLTLSQCTVNDCIILLQRHPQLVYCEITIHNFIRRNAARLFIPLTIYLPQLLSLRIGGPSYPKNLGEVLYNVIIAPKLRYFGYYNSFIHTINGAPDSRYSIPVHFIEGLIGLEKLQLQRLSFFVPNFLAIIKAASNTLIHLSLCDDRFRGCESPIINLVSHWDPFDLENLIVGNFPDGNMQTLLPSLEVFELDHTEVSDDIVLRFVTSRMKPQSPIAVIKKVVIQFNRLKDENGYDLSEEIRARADEAGVQVETTFHYALSTLQVEKKNNFLSPSYQDKECHALLPKTLEWEE
ncbi:hypothetical protein JR316_0008783 [Psilocybe cubensis]|uniref:Uncharacterized protein n=2 Tax=Psilocybe cubensis TaxID=181762 RepID=A0ACB8GRH5_PSICU|nr:hypothetical protein JR316_0008783 [Psilocybe cubensis]KAH9478330.1 hypothetical protein JR316_0008783 [Psilocybe cubensis]